MVNLFGKIFYISLASILSIEMLSWLSWDTKLNKTMFVIVIIITFLLSLKKLEWGIYVILAELFIGSKGYLFSLEINNFSISLRLGLFLTVFLVYIIWLIKDRKIKFFHSIFWKYYVLLLIFIIIALAIGYLRGNDIKNIFYDWNGYLFFGLILPLSQCLDNKQKYYNILQILLASAAALIIKTILLLFIFSQTNYFGLIVFAIYKWIRDTGIGEITKQPNGFYRIFMQSQIYLVISFFIGLSLLSVCKNKILNKKNWWGLFVITGLSLLTIFLSYSRSFWLGTIFILIIFFFSLLFIFKIKIKKIIIIITILIGVFTADYFIILGIINLPLQGNNSVSASSLITERTKDPSQEIAGSSRLNLLKPLISKILEHPIIGSGFGTTVTYYSNDLRHKEMTGTSTYTTYAFEWGYLDLWLKFGVIGFGVYLLLIFLILKKGILLLRKSGEMIDKSLFFGALLGLISIIFIHFFTPYLNHPLGISWLLVVSLFFQNND